MKIKASYHQERLWFIDTFEAGKLYEHGPVYHNIPLILDIGGPLNIGILEQSIREVVNRHEALRTRIVTENNKPVQFIAPDAEFELTLREAPENAEGNLCQHMLDLAVQESKKPFDLAKDFLIRGTLIRGEDQKFLLVLTLHHIICDRPSSTIIAREILICYEAFIQGLAPQLPDLPLHYADFSEWQREFPGDVSESLLSYWKRELKGKLQPLELPTDYPRAAVHTYQEGRYTFKFPDPLCHKILSLSRQEKKTNFIVLLAAFKILLHRYSGLEEIIVGTSVVNRRQAGTEGIVGALANLLVLRSYLTGDSTFPGISAQLDKTVSHACKYAALPFDLLVSQLNPEKDMSRTALFDVLFQYDENSLPPTKIDNLVVSMIDTNLGWGKYDINMLIRFRKREKAFRGILVYNKNYYKPTTISRLVHHYLLLLEKIAGNPAGEISEQGFLDEEEKKQLLEEWNQTRAQYPGHKTLGLLIREAAEKFPRRIALIYDEEQVQLTYEELDRQVRQMSANLKDNYNIRPNDLAGILVDRSERMIIGLLSILTAGGAYVPIDPGYPAERIQYILEDSQCKLLITGSNHKDKDKISKIRGKYTKYTGTVIDICDRELNREERSLNSMENINKPGDTAYVIYTSGTTGYPKGCLVSHRNLVRLFLTDSLPFFFDEHDVWVMAHSYCFDFSVWEMYGALLFNGKLIIPAWTSVQDVKRFCMIIKKHRVTILNQTPGAFYNFSAEEQKSPQKNLDKHLRYVCFGGDKLEPGYLKEWGAMYSPEKIRLINMFGITETTVHVTYYPLSPGDISSPGQSSPIGRPLPETTLYIYDHHLNFQPIGVPGQFYVGGSGVATGYLNKPQLTGHRFIKNPHKKGETIYKTGDLGKWREDGNAEYLGRIDHQVKIRGYRIEPGEIEAILMSLAPISKAIVITTEDADKDKCLTAYFITGKQPDVNEIRLYLKEFLPAYMIPRYFIRMESFPLTPTGKIDKRALPKPGDLNTSGSAYEAPKNRTEAILVEIWQEVLAIKKIGIHDDFFRLGGDSLKGIRVINSIQERLGEIVHIAALFQYPTVNELAARLAGYHNENLHSKINMDKAAKLSRLIKPLPPLVFPGFKNPTAVFILSPYRSGSTLLRIILAGHKRIFAPPELELLSFNTLEERKAALSDNFLSEGTLRAIMEAKPCTAGEAAAIMKQCEEKGVFSWQFYRMLQEWLEEREMILVDKTPSYTFHLDILKRAEVYFRSPRYIHLLRNPYAAIHSFKEAKIDQLVRFKHDFTAQELGELLWWKSHENILEFFKEIPAERSHTVKFEELVNHPAGVVQEICDFLGLAFEKRMLDIYGDTRHRMTDGIHSESRMIGDVKFFSHSSINASVADNWQKEHKKDYLGDITLEMARSLGYCKEPGISGYEEIKPLSKAEYYELSPAQKRLWILNRMEEHQFVYNMPHAFEFNEEINREALEKSFETVITRHESLRTVFITVSGRPGQKILDYSSTGFRIEFIDLRNQEQLEEKTRELSNQESLAPFDLEKGPLLRAKLIYLDKNRYLFLLTLHHIISDGWSMSLLLDEILILYNAYKQGKENPLSPLRLRYKDYAAWQNKLVHSERYQQQEKYWLNRFKDEIPVLNIPTDYERPEILSFNGNSLEFEIGEELTGIMKQTALEAKVTLNMLLTAAYYVLLSRCTGQEDMVIGTIIAGRPHPDLQDLIGFFVNMLPTGNQPRKDKIFRDFLTEVKENALEAYENQDYQFEELVSKLGVKRYPGRHPLVDTVFVLQTFNQQPQEGEEQGEAEDKPGQNLYEFADRASRLDLLFSGTEKDDSISMRVEYSTSLFKESTIQRFSACYLDILEQVGENINIKLEEITTPHDFLIAKPGISWVERINFDF